MKILIYNRKYPDDLVKKLRLDCTCSSVLRLNRLLDLYPESDVSGLIMRDASENPGFKEMMNLIYVRKRRLYDKSPQSYLGFRQRPDVEFADKIMREFPELYKHG